jgi:hypothetical protein
MPTRKYVLATGLVAVCLLLATSTGGFSAAEAERGVSVSVVGDDDAYISLVYPDDAKHVESGDVVTYLTVRNQFTEPVDLTVSPEADTDGSELIVARLDDAVDERLDDGHERSLEARFDCPSNTGETERVTVSFDVTAAGDSVQAEADTSGELRTVDVAVACPEPTPTNESDS